MDFITLVAAAAGGLLLGIKFRVPALMAATVLLIVLCGGIGLMERWTFVDLVFWMLALAATMQVFYFVGVALVHFLRSGRH